MVTKEKRGELIQGYRVHPTDTGSPEVQVALLTERISQITAHLKGHRHDYHGQRGLMQLVGQRKRFLAYLRREDYSRYRALVSKLGLRE